MLLIQILYRRKWMDCLDPCEKEGAEPGTASQLLLTHNLLSVFSVHHCNFEGKHLCQLATSAPFFSVVFLCQTLPVHLCCLRELREFFLHHTGTTCMGYALKIHKDYIQGKNYHNYWLNVIGLLFSEKQMFAGDPEGSTLKHSPGTPAQGSAIP